MEKKQKIFIYGLDYAGKTSVVETMKQEETMSDANPTLSFNISNYITENATLQIWDAPGQKSLRDSWEKGYNRADILVFVLDTADMERYDEAYAEFKKVLDHQLARGLPLIFLFHKMDLEKARANLKAAKDRFDLSAIKNRRVVSYYTSIYDLNSIKKFRSNLLDIVMGTMW